MKNLEIEKNQKFNLLLKKQKIFLFFKNIQIKVKQKYIHYAVNTWNF